MASGPRLQPASFLKCCRDASHVLISPGGRQQCDAKRQHRGGVAGGGQQLLPPLLLGASCGSVPRCSSWAQDAAEYAHAAHVLQVDEIGPPGK